MIIIRARLFLIDYQRVPVINLLAPSAVTGVSVGDLHTSVDWTQRLTFPQILSRQEVVVVWVVFLQYMDYFWTPVDLLEILG